MERQRERYSSQATDRENAMPKSNTDRQRDRWRDRQSVTVVKPLIMRMPCQSPTQINGGTDRQTDRQSVTVVKPLIVRMPCQSPTQIDGGTDGETDRALQ